MRDQMEARLAELQKDYDVGEKRLRELELETTRLRETLLRISGAIQVVQELLLDTHSSNGSAASGDHEVALMQAAEQGTG